MATVSAHFAATIGHAILLPVRRGGLPDFGPATAHPAIWTAAHLFLIVAGLLYPLSTFAFGRACHRLPAWLIPTAVALVTIGAVALVDQHVRGLAALAMAQSLEPDAANAAVAAVANLVPSPFHIGAGICFLLGQAILFAGIALDRDLRYRVGVPLAIGLILLLFFAWPWPQRLAPFALAVAAAILARRGRWEDDRRPTR